MSVLIPADKITGAVAFAREAFHNDGAEGETVHLLCDAIEQFRTMAACSWCGELVSTKDGNELIVAHMLGCKARVDYVAQAFGFMLDRTTTALNLALKFGGIDGEHHKAWTIDQMVRALCPDETSYKEWVHLQTASRRRAARRRAESGSVMSKTPEEADKELSRELKYRAKLEFQRRFTIEQCALTVERAIGGPLGTRQNQLAMRAANAVRALKDKKGSS